MTSKENKATVLVVDDEESIRTMVKALLQLGGYEVHTAEGAADAIAIAERLRCKLNVLLTDMVMPGIDGHDLIRAIRKMCPSMDTLLMTGAVSENDFRTRNYRTLAKPFNNSQLLAALQEVVDTQITF